MTMSFDTNIKIRVQDHSYNYCAHHKNFIWNILGSANSTDEDLRIHNEVHSEGAHPICGALSQQD